LQAQELESSHNEAEYKGRHNMFRITLVIGFLVSSSNADCLFNKRKDGEIVYGMNDGGCYFVPELLVRLFNFRANC